MRATSKKVELGVNIQQCHIKKKENLWGFFSRGFFRSRWLLTHTRVFSVDFCVFTALSVPLKKLFTSIVLGNKLTRSSSPD